MSNIAFLLGPLTIKDKNQIEKVQRRFTKMIPELHGLTYGNRLKALKLWTLEERREVFKLFRGISTLPFEIFSSWTWTKEPEVTQQS